MYRVTFISGVRFDPTNRDFCAGLTVTQPMDRHEIVIQDPVSGQFSVIINTATSVLPKDFAHSNVVFEFPCKIQIQDKVYLGLAGWKGDGRVFIDSLEALPFHLELEPVD